MQAEKIIRRFNLTNGNALNLSTAKELHAQAQLALDHDSHGPYAKPLETVRSKLTKFIKLCTEKNVVGIEHVEFDLVEYHPPIGIRDIARLGDAPKVGTDSLATIKEIVRLKEKRNKIPKNLVNKRANIQKEIDDLQKVYDTLKADKDLLHGLDHIQNDKEINGEQLGAIGDTTYKVITDKILSLIEKDGLIWRKPWNAKHPGKESHAHNYVTKNYYRGANYYLNYLLLSDYSSPYYFTFRQVEQLGGTVMKGQKGWPVIYFKFLYKKIGNGLVDETEAMAGNKLKPGYERFPALFYYTVFNLEQCEGLKVKPFKAVKITVKEKIDSCERIVKNMPKRPPIANVKGDRAFYVPSQDSITMPFMEQFKIDQEYYSTLFHEMVHSTGHPTRLDRDLTGRFGNKKYAFEELIAELGSSYLCGESGIFYFTMNNTAAYIKSWTRKLKEEMANDPKFFLKAAAAAERASEFILDGKEVKAKPKKEKVKAKPAPRVEKVSKPVDENKSAVKVSKPIHQQKEAVAVNGVETSLKNKQSTVDSRPKAKKAPSTQSGVNYSYKVVELGNYKKDFHRMFSDTIVQIHGMPGHGKTVYLLKKAQYRAQHTNDNVLYVAREEYGRSVFDMKLKEHNIGHKNLRFRKTLEYSDLKWATVVFLDSVTALKLTHEDVENLASEFPNRNWFVVLQSTKNGDFRGSQEWEHLVDIAGEVRNRKLILRKNRLDPNNSTKADKLLTDDAIQEAKKKKVIREAVKDAQPKAVEEPKQIPA